MKFKKNNSNKKPIISDEKLKPLKPTLRVKKRFVLVEIETENNFKISFEDFSKHVTEEIVYLMGSINFGKAGIWILKDKFDFDKQRGVFRVALDFNEEFLGALAMIVKLDDKKVALRVKRVSGTLKGLTNK